MLDEVFASEEALIEYEDAVTSSGLRSAVGEVLEFGQLILFSPLEDEGFNQVLDSMGAITGTPAASK